MECFPRPIWLAGPRSCQELFSSSVCKCHCRDSLLSLKESRSECFKLERRWLWATALLPQPHTETHGTHTPAWQFYSSFWELIWTCKGSLIFWKLQLYEPLIVFDATNNGSQKRKTKHSFNSVLHSVRKSRVQGKEFSLTRRNRGVCFCILFCLIGRAYSPEHKDLTRVF